MTVYDIYLNLSNGAVSLSLGEFPATTETEAIANCYAQLSTVPGAFCGKDEVDANGGITCISARYKV